MPSTPGLMSNGFYTLFCLLLGVTNAFAQAPQADPYVLNGSAVQNSCNCYTLTPESQFQSGSVWNKNKIDLSQSFDYHFNVFLGCRSDTTGADGIAFVLQPVSTSVGSEGDGLGFGGIVPSLGVTIDTYQNFSDDDPAFDHIAFQSNGDVNHADSNNLAGPIQALANSPDIKDCSWHILEVQWNAATQTLSAYMDGVPRLTMTKDIVHDIFHDNGLVFWGFTASTGGSYNLQQFCTSLNAGHSSPANQLYCENIPIAFTDSSTTFGSIINWFWNFGDGTASNAQDPPPHVYAAPGVYTVTENVLGNNGCLSDTDKTVLTIGSYPRAAFDITNACTAQPLGLVNNSRDSVGTFGIWTWTLSNGQTYADSLPAITIADTGSLTLSLSVVSKEGCASNMTDTSFYVYPTPQVAFQGDSVCAGFPLTLTGTLLNNVPVRQWYWQFGNTLFDSAESVTETFSANDTLLAKLWAISPKGCLSDTFLQNIQVQESYANAGNDTIIARGYPIQLHATGGTSYTWSPATNLSNPNIADPIATITENTVYTVTASTPAGCTTTASIAIKVYKGPAIYIANAFTPNGDGFNDVLAIVAPGISQLHYFTVYDRWGVIVFHTNDVHATWDGTLSGKPVPAGTYIWMAQGVDVTGNILNQKGTTVLIR